MKKIITVSVVITSYNQEEFIKQALDSVFIQKDIEFEVLFADDHSTDNTLNIIREYASKHSKISKIIPRKKNLGMCLNMYDAYHKAKGKYIAILEGDDYWTDELKLKKQCDFLEKNSKYSGVFNHYDCLINGKLKAHKEQNKLIANKKYEIYIKDLIKDNYIGNLSACMFRTNLIHSIDRNIFEKYFIADWLTGMIIYDKGGPLYLMPEKMSVYRIHGSSQWSKMSKKDKLFEELKALSLYDHILNYKYDYIFKEKFFRRLDMSVIRKIKKYRRIWKILFIINIILMIFILLK
tara:strand:+ start:2593 stop:3471 length:879 start_codon:yes stop_codon:yes gene_type:complete